MGSRRLRAHIRDGSCERRVAFLFGVAGEFFHHTAAKARDFPTRIPGDNRRLPMVSDR
jgi:hypothetical protein